MAVWARIPLAAGTLASGRGWRVALSKVAPHVLTVVNELTGECELEAGVAIAGAGPAARVLLAQGDVPRSGVLAEALRSCLPSGALALPLGVDRLVAALVFEGGLKDQAGRQRDVFHLDYNGLDNRVRNLVVMPEDEHDQLLALWPPRAEGDCTAALQVLARHVPPEKLRPAEKALSRELAHQRALAAARRLRVPPQPRPGAFLPPSREQVEAHLRPEARHQLSWVLAAARVLANFGPSGERADVFTETLAAAEGWAYRTTQQRIAIALSASNGLIRKASKTELGAKHVRYWLDLSVLGGGTNANVAGGGNPI